MLRGALGAVFVATIAGAAHSQRKASAAPTEVRWYSIDSLPGHFDDHPKIFTLSCEVPLWYKTDARRVHAECGRGLGGQRHRDDGAANAHIADAYFGRRQGTEARQAR